jgi:hypothetical protein
MQTVAISVSAIMSTALIIGQTTMMSAGTSITAESIAQTKSIIAVSYLDRELSEATEVVEATPSRVTVLNGEGDCASYSLDLDADRDLNLVRTAGGCDGFLPTRDVLVKRMSDESSFTYLNLANLSLVNGTPSGECDDSFTAAECASTGIRIVAFDGVSLNPLTGKKRLSAHVVTSATSYELIESPTGMDDVVIAPEATRADEFAD